jgi:hypothetical protein
VVTGYARHIRDDGESAETGPNLVEGEPKAGSAGDSGGLDPADMAADFGTRREEDACSGFEGLQGADTEAGTLSGTVGVEFVLQTDKKLRTRGDGVGLNGDIG